MVDLLCATSYNLHIVHGNGTSQTVRSAVAMSRAYDYIQGRKSLISRDPFNGCFSQITRNPDGTPTCEHVSRDKVRAERLVTALEYRDNVWFLELNEGRHPILHDATTGRPFVVENRFSFYYGVFAETRGGQLAHASAGGDFILDRELSWFAYKLWTDDNSIAPCEIAEGAVLYSTSYSNLYARDIRVAQPHVLDAPYRDLSASISSIDDNIYVVHNGVISLYDERNNALVGMQISPPENMRSFKPIRVHTRA